MTSIKDIKEGLKAFDQWEDLPIDWRKDPRKGVQTALASWKKQQEKRAASLIKLSEMKSFERAAWERGYQAVVGIDEVGRGPLAGPVVAAAVLMPKDSQILGVDDSKKLSAAKREALYDLIMDQALAVGLGVKEAEVIDQVNIYQATKLAMQAAIDQLEPYPDYLLIDAMTLENGLPQESLIKGDARSYSIACASIVAKVYRDRLMADYAKTFPGYGFEKNAGYGTKDHLEGLKHYGVTALHRRSFEPVKSMLEAGGRAER